MPPPPCSNSLDRIDFAMHHHVIPQMPPRSNNRDCFNFVRAMGILDDDERVQHVANFYETTPLGLVIVSPLSQSTTAAMS